MIAPITGMLRKRLVLDLSIASGLGLSAGYASWYFMHVPAMRRRDDFYAKLEQERAEKADA